MDPTQVRQSPGLIFVFVILGLMAIMWMAVRFHNEVLRPDEATLSLGENLKRSFGYLGRTILLGFIVGIPLAIVMGILSPILIQSGALFAVMMLFLACIAGWVLYRLSPILPAGAIAKPISMGQAWEATRNYSSALFMLVILLVVIDWALGFLLGRLPWPLSILSLAVDWFVLIVGVSLYTTLYGVAVEGRELH